jgi:hypothetical protein
VTTMFGPLLIGLGPWGAAAYTWGLGLLAYGVFAAATLTRNCWLVVMWLFVAAMLAFGWFGLFFALLIAIEGPVLCGLLAIAIWIAPRRASPFGADKSPSLARSH